MPTPSPLIGHWRLVSYTEKKPTGETINVWGAGAKGYLSYFPDGRMMVMAAGNGRPRFRGAWDTIPIEQKATAYDRLIAYAGRFTDLGERVVHHVEVCWIPNWEGKDLERLVLPAGEGRMILRAPAGRSPVQDLLWKRLA